MTSDASVLPPWNYLQLDTPDEVIKLTAEITKKYEHTYVWSWINKEQSKVRARTFAPDWGISEDEANGSGSMKLALQLGRNLIITHGRGSVILTENVGLTVCKVGGRVSFYKDAELD